MRDKIASRIISRTTINIDPTVLRHVRRLARSQGKTLAQVVSELLAIALASYRDVPVGELSWKAKPMGARVDLEDKEAVYEALEGG